MTTKRTLVASVLRTIAVLSSTMLIASCADVIPGISSPSNGPEQESNVSTPFAERPPTEVVVAELDALQAVIREAVTAAVPTVVWRAGRDESGTTCGEPGAYGMRVSLPRWVADGVSDDDWSLVVDAVAAASAAYGFSAPVVVADSPGDHTVQLFGDNGAVIDIGSFVNMLLAVTTGCHPFE